MSISLTPCDKVENFGFQIDEQCIADRNEQNEYLAKKYYYTQLIYNYETFDPEKYNEAAINKYAGLITQVFNVNKNNKMFFEQQV